MRLSKIVATVGPRSQDPETLKALMEAGVNVFRLNFSHGDHAFFETIVGHITRLRAELDKPVAILGDIQGPKFRVGELVDHQPVPLETHSLVELVVDDAPGTSQRVTTKWDALVSVLEVDQRVLLDDGSMELKVEKVLSPTAVQCRVIKGGVLKEKKGINVPGLIIDIPPLTEKDKADCKFAMTQPMDFLALSFVQTEQDIRYLRDFLGQNNPSDRLLPSIIAKIENPQSLDHIHAIMEETDGIMVARGDMGVEMALEKVPFVQKQLIQLANEYQKPVITATQMLESMVKSSTPTRAEVSDIANAICDGSDALMLSAETAAGDFPVETVTYMAQVMREAERNLPPWHRPDDRERMFMSAAETPYKDGMAFHEAIAQTAVIAARRSDAKALIVFSNSGSMAKRVSKRKPRCPIITLTSNDSTYYRTNLMWGTYPVKIEVTDRSDETLAGAEEPIDRLGLVHGGQTVVFCAGQTRLVGLTNLLKINRLDQIIRPARVPEAHTDTMRKPPEVVSV